MWPGMAGMRAARRVERGAVTASLAALVACGSAANSAARSPPSPASSAPEHTAAAGGPSLRGTITVSGDYNMSTGFTTHAVVQRGGFTTPAPVGTTCADYARGFGASPSFTAPEIQTAGDHALYLRASVDGVYTGPGTYTTESAARSLSGSAIVTVPSSAGPAFTVYNSKIHGTTALTVHADGSGTLTFDDWGDDENRAGHIAGYLSGSVTWTCSAA